ncbi:MAG: hypothetical protein R2777_05150 [Chitinophagales bacterium]
MWLVLGGCGSAMLLDQFWRRYGNPLGIGFVESLAFSLTVVTIAYSLDMFPVLI